MYYMTGCVRDIEKCTYAFQGGIKHYLQEGPCVVAFNVLYKH